MGEKNAVVLRMLLFSSMLLALFAGNLFAVCSGSPTNNCGGYTAYTDCPYNTHGGCSGGAPGYCIEEGAGTIDCGGISYPTYNCALDPSFSCSSLSSQSACTDAGCTWTLPCSNAGQSCGGANPDCCTGLGLTCTNQICQPSPPPPACSNAGQPCGGANPACCTGLGLTCTNSICQGAPPSCGGIGALCGGSNPGCCGGLDCTETGSIYTCQQPSPGSGGIANFCRPEMFNEVIGICAIAGLSMAILVALAYMAGEMFSNPRLLTWSKTEAFQVFLSLSAVALILWSVSVICIVPLSEIQSIAALPNLPDIYVGSYSNENIYGGAILYLENLAGAGLANMASLRYNLGAYEIRTSYSDFECDIGCLFTLSSTNVAVYGGETMYLALTNNLLGIATASQLATYFMYFTLRYIVNGLFIFFLPLAIIMRSVPFMRQFGGALMGIFLALYLFYPFMLVADAFIVPGLAKAAGVVHLYERGTGCTDIGIEIFSSATGRVVCHPAVLVPGFLESGTEGNMFIGDFNIGSSVEDLLPDNGSGYFEQLVKLNVLIFLAAVFLPALNFIVIAALARDLSGFLGTESDISRLGQMV